MGDADHSDATKRPSFVWLSFLTSVVGGIIGFGAAQFFAYAELRAKQDEIADKIHATKLKVVEHVASADFNYADAILVYLLKPIEKDEAAFNEFRNQVRSLKADKAPTQTASATTPPPQEFSSAIPFPYAASMIRNKFATSERLELSDELVNLYKSHPSDTVEALLAALVPEQSDGLNRYRINLYVVFTLARIPGGWRGSAPQIGRLKQLAQSSDHGDATFASRLAEAISNYRQR